MEWHQIKTRLRRFLRDPDGGIWGDAELLQYFNDAALEIANKIGAIIRVEAHYYPPLYDFSYLFIWEGNRIEGIGYQALIQNQASGDTTCYPWETAYWLDTIQTPDDGIRITHPFEVYYGSPADVLPVPLHEQFNKMLYCAYDEEPLNPINEYDLAVMDGYYRSRIGQPANYYRPDQAHNRIVIYPRPNIVFQEPDYTDALSDTGGLKLSESWLNQQDMGLTLDIVNTEDSLVMVYEALPQTLVNLEDEPDFAPYLIKYAEYATLERAFGAETDGFIPSLRDYWGMRKKIGIEAIKKWKRLKLINRQYCLGKGIPRTRSRHPRLPEHYPEVGP